MSDSDRGMIVTRVALLELKDERRLVQEGYDLLDEKRILLAAQIRHKLARMRALRAQSNALEQKMRDALISTVRRHGTDELSVYPPSSTADIRLTPARSRLLGLDLIDAKMEGSVPDAPERAVNPTPEARACAAAHLQWLACAIPLAACCVSLRRLVREYQRTERRARAIENVILPEIEVAMKFIDEHLEGADQEEIARLRRPRAVPA